MVTYVRSVERPNQKDTQCYVAERLCVRNQALQDLVRGDIIVAMTGHAASENDHLHIYPSSTDIT